MQLFWSPIWLCLGTLVYSLRYWHSTSVPDNDFISPLIVMVMAGNLLYNTFPSLRDFIIVMSLVCDGFADYNMNGGELTVPVLLFAWGHCHRQTVFFYTFYSEDNEISLVLYALTLILMVNITIFFEESLYHKLLIPGYITIITLTLVNARILTGALSVGLTLFIISDLMIVYDKYWKTIYPRQLRIILAPVLFWTAEVLIMYELS